MKSITSTSAALIVATLGLGAMAPAALAQDQGPRAGPGGAARQEQGFRAHNQDGPRQGLRRGGLLQLVCAERGAERLEHMFVAISHRIDLTAEQAPLFDALKTAALSAQTGFADTCASVRPEAGKPVEIPNLVERLETRIKIDEARIAALSDVLPSLEAFYSSLSDEQRAKLDVPGEMRRKHFGDRRGSPDRRPGQHRPMMDQNG
ncbi:MAG: Spy/CpxP family protein refolding chaperone [Devosia sp.]